ncbi:glucosaminidase domain-containing protein [Dysgonomonas sp. Marseille-P4677]|uniref:glucosaminidase domain-containing protein n=1 Tax=Dysgonomonas sp. Marseille-P4677 TaxID=2364790 RepID=UPI001911E20B|nr:glucosaminidase domain-containing protein [Dysgonomonas sp. Marseille-P4677]MBK5722373.1 glucosaminidase domain-containing protein [Dysgonomonas sp. Marseille-P4677]
MKKTYYLNVSIRLIILSGFLLFTTVSAFAQAKRYKIYDDYIDTYKHIAIEHMKKYKIPASITLAQGLLESGAGKSSLTQSSNNHFGIKCHNDWTGGRVYKADDNPNDCFRKYKKAEDSYEDHSRFLADKQRYRSLFSLSITDYRGWARGLQQAGYATDKAYANKLIKLIEDYQLYQHDKKGSGKDKEKEYSAQQRVKEYKHVPYKTHNLVYVIAQDGDTYEGIAAEFGFKPKDLYKYNEVPEGFPLKEGDLVYFEKKKSKADKPYYDHVVQVGESMHSISQLYGLKVKNLYKINKKDFEYVPEEGDVLKLR